MQQVHTTIPSILKYPFCRRNSIFLITLVTYFTSFRHEKSTEIRIIIIFFICRSICNDIFQLNCFIIMFSKKSYEFYIIPKIDIFFHEFSEPCNLQHYLNSTLTASQIVSDSTFHHGINSILDFYFTAYVIRK